MSLEKVKTNKPPTKDEIKGRLIFGPIMIIGGILMLLFVSYPKYQMGVITQNWPTTDGEITEVRILAYIDGSHQRAFTLEHHDGREGVRFRLIPYYRYTVDSNSYQNSRIYLMESNSDGIKRLKNARKEAKLLNKNSTVTVSYNPADPQDSILEPGLRFGMLLFIIMVPLVLFAAGIPVTYSGVKHTFFPQSTSNI